MNAFLEKLKSAILVVITGLILSACSGSEGSDATETEQVQQKVPASSEPEITDKPSDEVSEEYADDTTSATWKED